MSLTDRFELSEPQLLWSDSDAPNSKDYSRADIIEYVDEHQSDVGLGVRLWRRGDGEWWWYLRKAGNDWLGINPEEEELDAMDADEAEFFLRQHEDSAVQDVWAIPMESMPRWGDGSAV